MISTSTSSASLSSVFSSATSTSDVAPAESLKLVIVCVGLPARGKSYITKKLQRYFNWSQFNTKIFNVGNTRRQKHAGPSDYPILGPTTMPATTTMHNANFFDASNKRSFTLREKWARETLDRLLDFLLYEEGNVGIFDATNTTKQRRRWIIETVTQRMRGSAKILFLESICTDNELIEKNIHLKLMGPDYRKMDRNLALEDFRKRLHNYEQVYETIDEDEEAENEVYGIQYVKIVNAGKKLVSYNISGYLSSQCVFFLLNFNLSDRQIWLTTNGESQDNVEHIQGGDSGLSSKGWKFAKALPKFIGKKRQEFKLRQLNKQFIKDAEFACFHDRPQMEPKFNVWTSTLERTNETVRFFPRNEYHLKAFKMLNDMCYGSFDSTAEVEIRDNHIDDYRNMMQNKLSYRFPGLGGESHLDVIARLRPIIVELERLKDHVLIVSHRVIIRVLICYFMNLSKEMLTELDVQHDYVYCIEPKPYGLDLKIWQYDEVTDDFYEVDEIELMQRKRRRASLSVDNHYKPVLRSELDASTEDVDEDTLTEQQSNQMDIKQYQKVFCERSDSQCYEFADSNDTGSGTSQLDREVKKIMANQELVKEICKQFALKAQ
ncbi:hypothetical protein FOA43_004636 [Brettanomyces nanus]|uniref:6-phosphofructo-2-kinase domain-containing protein n=1 Tax=Eeniella nana TaxID=13502 RepID=A0A875SCQ5_EENNA|nr:uncharacterized protein FOA43_004636 [Brettanomyces nanus]QPG77229.1 hypothetical protein FOA43_004636 [Brettanomyces nanus]